MWYGYLSMRQFLVIFDHTFLHLVLKTWYFYQFVIMVVSDLSEIGSVDTDCEGRLCGDICEYTQRLWNNTEQKNGLCNEEGRCHGAMVQCGMNTFSCYNC